MSTEIPEQMDAALVLADGSVFFGYGVGAEGQTIGEICFNTSMTGYQEIITDPSYAGQIITFTFPHIGNTGTNKEDIEAKACAARGIIIREKITNPANFRSESDFNIWLKDNGLIGISGIDTRALTISIRKNGPQNVGICFYQDKSKIDLDAFLKEIKQYPSLDGMELAEGVSTSKKYNWDQSVWNLDGGYGKAKDINYRVVAVDFGAKLNILRCLTDLGCEVTVVPATASAEDIFSLNPDGVFLSNGPGDPSATGEYALPMIKEVIDCNIPLFGICLGHQLISLAVGAKTEKMHQGHRGANHPVKNLETGNVEITSQNHGFVVKEETLPDNVEVTHRSLFDNSVEGVRIKDKPVFSVQYHPESSPGPHDSHYLFKQFIELMEQNNSEVSLSA